MNDELLFERLAGHGGPAAFNEDFEARLFSLLQRDFRRRESAWRRRLIAAALVAVFAITAAAAAIGSGLIAPPWVNPLPTETPATSYVVTAEQVPSLGTHRMTFTVPDGWTDLAGRGVRKEDLSLTVWVSPRGIWVNPCYWRSGQGDLADFADPPFYRSMDVMLDAFWVWWDGGEGGAAVAGDAQATLPRGTKPTTTKVDGWNARYVEFRAPDDLNLASCLEGEYRIWVGIDGQIKTISAPGELNQLWLLKVGLPDVRLGGFVLIDASSSSRSSPQDLAELHAMVDSIRIE